MLKGRGPLSREKAVVGPAGTPSPSTTAFSNDSDRFCAKAKKSQALRMTALSRGLKYSWLDMQKTRKDRKSRYRFKHASPRFRRASPRDAAVPRFPDNGRPRAAPAAAASASSSPTPFLLSASSERPQR